MKDMNEGYTNQPPRTAAVDERWCWKSVVTGAAPAMVDIWGSYTAAVRPYGKVWVEFESTAATAYIRFNRVNGPAGCSSANGTAVPINAATKVKFLVDPLKDVYLDVVATGAGTLKYRICSHDLDRNRQ
jgi:hypothetical protein